MIAGKFGTLRDTYYARANGLKLGNLGGLRGKGPLKGPQMLQPVPWYLPVLVHPAISAP